MRRNILMVDDNPGDIRLVREAFGAGPRVAIHEAEDAAHAIEFLENNDCDLVLLDLSLPRTSGHELLADIRSREPLRALPVVVFSTSDSSDDIERAYAAHANCYVTKPGELDRFLETFRRIEQFWFETARLP